MNTPLVSVVVSSYNHAPYIEDCLLSILQQDYPNIELLVVDDGSTDDSVTRIRRLQEQYGFEFQTQTNRGLTATLNAAFSRAKGEWLAPFGSDDIMLPERLSSQIAHVLDKPEIGICGGNIELINSDGSSRPQKEQRPNIPFRRLCFEDVFLGEKPGIAAPTMLIRRSAFEEVGGFDPDIRLEDLYIQLQITRAGYVIDALDAVLAKYRKHPSNSYKNLRFMTDAILRIYAGHSDHPDYERVYCKFINSMFLKAANRDKALAKELLQRLPLRYWNRRTLRGLGRYFFSIPSA